MKAPNEVTPKAGRKVAAKKYKNETEYLFVVAMATYSYCMNCLNEIINPVEKQFEEMGINLKYESGISAWIDKEEKIINVKDSHIMDAFRYSTGMFKCKHLNVNEKNICEDCGLIIMFD